MMVYSRQNPTVEIPKRDPPNEDPPTSPLIYSPQTNTYVKALQRFLPSSTELADSDSDSFSCDEFRMYEFKVRKCTRGRSHDWTECPFAHPGEKARRRDPRKYHYSGNACPDFRRGGCLKGDTCQYAHGVFECWLHPARYRTHPCKDGAHCKRRVCFFAHSPEQLRVLGFDPEEELVGPMMGLHVGESTWRAGLGLCDTWRSGIGEEEVMERVESGKGLRARIYGKVGMENSLSCDRVESPSYGPDFGWVSELVK